MYKSSANYDRTALMSFVTNIPCVVSGWLAGKLIWNLDFMPVAKVSIVFVIVLALTFIGGFFWARVTPVLTFRETFTGAAILNISSAILAIIIPSMSLFLMFFIWFITCFLVCGRMLAGPVKAKISTERASGSRGLHIE